MRDRARLEELRSALAVDGYHLSVDEAGSGFDVRITADPGTCGDCLVPKHMMARMLRPILGADEHAIRLSYPGDLAETGETEQADRPESTETERGA